MEHRYYGEDVTEYAFRGDDRRSTHGLKVVISNEDHLEDPEATFQDIINLNQYRQAGSRMHMFNVLVCVKFVF